jgi:8-oxo-dGTP pyrophosphatase MutT (NUDIX family)
VRSLHDDALSTLRGWTAPDPGQERLRRRYVDHLEAHPDGLSRQGYPAHLTAGALVLSADRSQVLLTLHAKARRWFHLGGHLEPDDASLVDAAGREALEESGLPRLELDPMPLHLDAHQVAFCGDHEQVTHLDVRFLAVAAEGARPAVSEESLDVRWWPVDELPTDEATLWEMLAAGVRRAAQRSSEASAAASSSEQSGEPASTPS